MRKLNKSHIETWLKRNRFTHIGYGSTVRSSPTMNSWLHRNGQYLIRVRKVDGSYVVDIGEHVDTFDRWANSSVQCDVPYVEFVCNNGSAV